MTHLSKYCQTVTILERSHATTVAWSNETEVWKVLRIGKKEKSSNYTKSPTPCYDSHQFENEEMETVGELSNVCSQIVLKCL